MLLNLAVWWVCCACVRVCARSPRPCRHATVRRFCQPRLVAWFLRERAPSARLARRSHLAALERRRPKSFEHAPGRVLGVFASVGGSLDPISGQAGVGPSCFCRNDPLPQPEARFGPREIARIDFASSAGADGGRRRLAKVGEGRRRSAKVGEGRCGCPLRSRRPPEVGAGRRKPAQVGGRWWRSAVIGGSRRTPVEVGGESGGGARIGEDARRPVEARGGRRMPPVGPALQVQRSPESAAPASRRQCQCGGRCAQYLPQCRPLPLQLWSDCWVTTGVMVAPCCNMSSFFFSLPQRSDPPCALFERAS